MSFNDPLAIFPAAPTRRVELEAFLLTLCLSAKDVREE
jgi:hypothetical protein